MHWRSEILINYQGEEKKKSRNATSIQPSAQHWIIKLREAGAQMKIHFNYNAKYFPPYGKPTMLRSSMIDKSDLGSNSIKLSY